MGASREPPTGGVGFLGWYRIWAPPACCARSYASPSLREGDGFRISWSATSLVERHETYVSTCMFMAAEHLQNEHRREFAPAGGPTLGAVQEPDAELDSDAWRDTDDETQGDADEAKLEPRMSLWTVPEKWGGGFFLLLVSPGGDCEKRKSGSKRG